MSSNTDLQKVPVALVILDGWGYRSDLASNAIANAQTPTMDKLWRERPHSLIKASGMPVGLPDGQMGNSEVGHVNIGAGRVVYQDLTRVTKSILDGDFQTNLVLTTAIDKAVNTNNAVHIMGLLSQGGVHSHEDHIYAAIELAVQRGAEQVYLHAFLDGRDTPPRSAMKSLERFHALFDKLGKGRIASIIGRYYAMDRDNNWDRVQKCYDLLTLAKSEHCYHDAMSALQAAYDCDKNDEFVPASEIRTDMQSRVTINDGDSVLFMNFRADRAREITRCFMNDFTGFSREKTPKLADFVMLTEYAADIKASCAYAPEDLKNTLGDWLSQHHKTQLRISETEKYAHVTFFFNGGQEAVFEGEDRILINSPKVATYDMQPEMSSRELTEKLVEAIKSGKYDMIICNYPNGDMVGHTGVYEAAVSACEAVDHCIQQVVAAIEAVGGQLLISADHGNAEMMADPATGQAHTAHTSLPVPLIYVGSRDLNMLEGGQLSDLAPTLLALADMPQPKEMTGHSLLVSK